MLLEEKYLYWLISFKLMTSQPFVSKKKTPGKTWRVSCRTALFRGARSVSGDGGLSVYSTVTVLPAVWPPNSGA